MSGKRKRWFEEGSTFRKGLSEALKKASLDWPIEPFPWSGANSVDARDDAAKKLSDRVKGANGTTVIIAHSHGGSVALCALKHLGSDVDRIRVVSLATPFLKVFAHKFELPLSVYYFLLLGAAVPVCFPLIVVVAILSSHWLPLESWPYWVLAIVSVVLFLASLWPASLIVSRFQKIFINSQVAGALAEKANFDAKGLRMLVVRGVDDEASMALAAGSIGSRLSYLVLTGVIPGIFLLLFVLGLLAPVLPGSEDIWRTITLSAIAVAFLFMVLPGVFKSAFGREFLLNALVCEIAADTVPDNADRVEAITLAPIERPAILQLRHGIYDNPQCVEEIVQWLRRFT